MIVRQVEGSSTAATTIDSLGGDITANLASINGFVADVPNGALDVLASLPGVASVTQNFSVTLHGAGWDNKTQAATLDKVTHSLGANAAWFEGYTGDGVTIALLDTGITQVDGLATSGKVVNGADLSFDSQTGTLYTDGYGHGTHLAGIMAGRSNNADAVLTSKNVKNDFLGIAPDAPNPECQDWVRQRSRRHLPGHRWNRLGGRAPQRQWHERSSLEPLFRNGQHTVLHDRPARFRRGTGLHNGIVVVVSSGNDGARDNMRSPATDPLCDRSRCFRRHAEQQGE